MAEYRIGPGAGEWLSYEEVTQILAAWESMPPGRGVPSLTISKRPKQAEQECVWLPGDATLACDWDPTCQVHGKLPNTCGHHSPDGEYRCARSRGHTYPHRDVRQKGLETSSWWDGE